jgi:hypothetical protein
VSRRGRGLPGGLPVGRIASRASQIMSKFRYPGFIDINGRLDRSLLSVVPLRTVNRVS